MQNILVSVFKKNFFCMYLHTPFKWFYILLIVQWTWQDNIQTLRFNELKNLVINSFKKWKDTYFNMRLIWFHLFGL